MSRTPTAGNATPNRSGLWSRHAATSRPPLLPPAIAIFFGLVYFSAARYSAAAMKSSNTFCFASLRARHMPLPAILAAASYSRRCNDAAHFEPHHPGRNIGHCHRHIEAAVAVEIDRIGSIRFISLRYVRNIGTRVPSLLLIENQFGFVRSKIRRNFRLLEDLALACLQIVMIDGGRNSVALNV